MIEIKGRTFEGPLAEMIMTTPELGELFNDIFNIEVDDEGNAPAVRWD